VYNIRVSAMTYGRSTNDMEVRVIAMVEVNIYMEKDETETCENNTISAYAPGAQSVRLLCRYDDRRDDEEFDAEDGESVWTNGINRGHSGEYFVYAEARYEGEEGGEDRYGWSEELLWRRYAWNDQLERVLDSNATLTLPSTMKTIGEEAFTGTSAQIVVIPDGATAIESRAFADSAVG